MVSLSSARARVKSHAQALAALIARDTRSRSSASDYNRSVVLNPVKSLAIFSRGRRVSATTVTRHLARKNAADTIMSLAVD